jgi:hypothetical protein
MKLEAVVLLGTTRGNESDAWATEILHHERLACADDSSTSAARVFFSALLLYECLKACSMLVGQQSQSQ